ncbi:hypothetical protein CK203_000201 [Vitis vinifera]|uniref:DUF4283 domain-containing protein n=1 Tax=Vitis vinifera TaxID=29760 RepID=A0A438KPK5_VITVI|nr:hypothetical protein CK203_000201 [Vitis vinifera]
MERCIARRTGGNGKTNSFGVESKAFELEMVEKGGTTLTITESKKGVSSWVRMGLNSVGLLMEGLQQCIEDRRDGNWEKRWKEKGRSFSMGKGSKGGWTAMVEALCQLGIIADRKVQQEGMRISGRRSPEKVKGRSFVDMVKAWGDKEPSPFEWRWDGRRLAETLAGKMGIASMGKGRALLELSSRKKQESLALGSFGVEKGGRRLWWILRCGSKDGEDGGVEWARILIKSDGANTPGSLVIGIEEISYSLSLWWESVPVLRQEEGRKCCLSDRLRGESRRDREKAAVGPTIPGYRRMLEEEAARYGLDVNLGGLRVQGASSSNSFVLVGLRKRRVMTILGCKGRGCDWKRVPKSKCRGPYREKEWCWDLVEINSVEPLGRKLGWMADQTEPQEGSKEDQLNWEESSLVRFSQFLGFSTEGLEVEILNFLDKIRKRKEKIIGKGFLEASRFERELKRLECSVNYEGKLRRKAL